MAKYKLCSEINELSTVLKKNVADFNQIKSDDRLSIDTGWIRNELIKNKTPI